MNARQKRFCDEYLIDLNAAQAAVRAGYSPHSAKQRGHQLLHDAPETREYIQRQLAALHEARGAGAQEVIEYLTAVMRGESESEIVVVESMGSGMSAARKIRKAPDEKERLKAAELLGRRHGLFSDGLKLTGAVPVVITGADALED